jgi:hypothetical protein
MNIFFASEFFNPVNTFSHQAKVQILAEEWRKKSIANSENQEKL